MDEPTLGEVATTLSSHCSTVSTVLCSFDVAMPRPLALLLLLHAHNSLVTTTGQPRDDDSPTHGWLNHGMEVYDSPLTDGAAQDDEDPRFFKTDPQALTVTDDIMDATPGAQTREVEGHETRMVETQQYQARTRGNRNVDIEDEEHPSPSLRVNVSSNVEQDVMRESLNFWLKNPELLPRRGREQNTSDTTMSTSAASGCSTPPPVGGPLPRLEAEVGCHLAFLVEDDRAIIAQMLAQELCRLATFHHDDRVRRALELMRSTLENYLIQDFEVGIVLDEPQGKWLSHVITRASLVQFPVLQHDEHCLMGAPRDRWQWRSRERSRSRTTSRPPRGNRQRKGVYGGQSQSRMRGRTTSTTQGRGCNGAEGSYTRTVRRLEPPTTGLPVSRAATMSANRMVWRALLGMEDEAGPH